MDFPPAGRSAVLAPLALLGVAILLLAGSYAQTGEFVKRSFEMKGGTLVSVKLSQPVSINEITERLEESFGKAVIRELKGISGSSIMINVDESVDGGKVIEALNGMGIDTRDSSVQTIGAAIGETFFVQAQGAVAFAFVLMGIIVFLIFREPLPSLYMIFAAFTDIVVTLGFMQLFGIELSFAALGAILMLIGYSIDTDIMLTSRILKQKEGIEIKQKFRQAFITGITMTGTSIGALTAILISSISPVLVEIASVLMIGLVADIIVTWLFNAPVLGWYVKKRGYAV